MEERLLQDDAFIDSWGWEAFRESWWGGLEGGWFSFSLSDEISKEDDRRVEFPRNWSGKRKRRNKGKVGLVRTIVSWTWRE